MLIVQKETNTIQRKNAYLALGMAFCALILNFWAWSLLSPLGVKYAQELSLEPVMLSVLLAVPVIIGSLGRLFIGALTDKLGGRKMFAVISLFMVLPVVGLACVSSYWALVFVAFFLGFGGASFVIGIPFVSAWFEPSKRGLMLGLYSMGNAGTALSGFLTPSMSNHFGRSETFFIVAGLLAMIGGVFLLWGKDSPLWKPAKTPPLKSLRLASKERMTWDLSVVYAITFGAFVAFGVYLPVLLKTQYNLELTDAATRAAGFILLATIARPFGGWMSDKVGAVRVIPPALFVVVVLAMLIAFQPTLHLATTVLYLSLAFVLGCVNGAVFGILSRRTKPSLVGSVTGIVGAIGGFGGFLPPLILGLTYQRYHSFAPALMMLSLSAGTVLVYINERFKDRMYR